MRNASPKVNLIFLDQVVQALGMQPDPDRSQAILNIPKLQNVADVRGFPGKVNQLSTFRHNIPERKPSYTREKHSKGPSRD